MKSIVARFNLAPTRVEVLVMIMLGVVFLAGLVGAGSGVYTRLTDDHVNPTTSAAPTGIAAEASPAGTTPQDPSGRPSLEEGVAGDQNQLPEAESTARGLAPLTPATASSTTTAPSAMRTVRISLVVHRGSGDFSNVSDQPFHGVCHPEGIRRYHEGAKALWEEQSGVVKFGTPLRLTFEVPADQQVWCAFYLMPHAHWERATDVQSVVNGASHSGTNIECLLPAPGKSYMRSVESAEYLPGRFDECDAAYTIVH